MRALPIAVLLATAGAAEAEAEPARSLRVSVDGVLPFADWDQVAGPGLGASALAVIPLDATLAITARVGAVVHAEVDGGAVATRQLELPLLGGARYQLARLGRLRGVVLGEVGVVATRTRARIGGVSDADTDLGFAASIGGAVGYDRVELRFGAWLANLADLDRGVGASASLDVEVLRW